MNCKQLYTVSINEVITSTCAQTAWWLETFCRINQGRFTCCTSPMFVMFFVGRKAVNLVYTDTTDHARLISKLSFPIITVITLVCSYQKIYYLSLAAGSVVYWRTNHLRSFQIREITLIISYAYIVNAKRKGYRDLFSLVALLLLQIRTGLVWSGTIPLARLTHWLCSSVLRLLKFFLAS